MPLNGGAGFEGPDRAGREEAPEMYPVLLRLAGRECLIVGGGAVALRKAGELLRCGALVHVVAPDRSADFTELAGNACGRRLRLDARRFEPRDLDGVFLAFAATGDRATQEEIARLAAERGILCNVVDVTELGSFFVPATLRRGSLTVSVATEGKSPLFAVALRDRLAASLPPGIAGGVELLAEGRTIVRSKYPGDPARRREALGRLLPPRAAEHLFGGRIDLFEEHWKRWRASLSD